MSVVSLAPPHPIRTEVPSVPKRAIRRGTRRSLWMLAVLQILALNIQVAAVVIARRNEQQEANIVSFVAFGLAFLSALWLLTRRDLSRMLRNAAVACLAITPAVQWHIGDPFPFASYDETLHMRALRQIESSHRLFQPHPLLEVTAHYPGLESLAALFHQFGLPESAAAGTVVLLARLALVFALCAAAEEVAGSIRVGGLAVAVYAVSPQFVMFNSQFSYQTLSLPLSLTAVALVARARWSIAWRPLLGAAGICLVAVALTHHLTSVITALFLLLWTLVQSGRHARRVVMIAAGIALTTTSVWIAVQLPVLRDYFTPMIDQLSAQLFRRPKRALFSENSGQQSPLWEKLLLANFGAVVSGSVGWLLLFYGRRLFRRAKPTAGQRADDVLPRRTTVMLLAIVSLIPILFAVRVMPRWGEFGDRASSFLYLPFSLLVALAVVRRSPRVGVNFVSRRGRHFIGRRMGAKLARPLLMVLATGVFLGGYLLGSGAEWSRLPGSYEPAAERRSLDSETLAAVRWARDNLPAGTRIGADRIGSTLLSSEAGLWPVHTYADGVDLPSLYQADTWGLGQTEMAQRLEVRYLYVDTRFAETRPRIGGYFDEAGPGLHFTIGGLTKFRFTPGIREIYRHGPISIYDLGGLGVPTLRSGWIGETPPPTALPIQAAGGLLVGAALGTAAGSRLGRRLAPAVRSLRAAAGAPLLLGVSLAAASLLSIVLLLAGIWFGPVAPLAVILGGSLANPRAISALFLGVRTRLTWRWAGISALTAAGLAVGVVTAAHDALNAQTPPAAARPEGCELCP